MAGHGGIIQCLSRPRTRVGRYACAMFTAQGPPQIAATPRATITPAEEAFAMFHCPLFARQP